MEEKSVSKLDTRAEPLASEIYKDLKAELRFKNWLIVGLIFALFCMGLYHNWRWNQFETIVVDAESGYANYVTGENTGGVHNGTSSSASAEGRQD